MNEQLVNARDILRLHGYHCIRGNMLAVSGVDDTQLPIRLEWWTGKLGVLIIQHSEDHPGRGVFIYADWPLGHTFDSLREALQDAPPDSPEEPEDLTNELIEVIWPRLDKETHTKGDINDTVTNVMDSWEPKGEET